MSESARKKARGGGGASVVAVTARSCAVGFKRALQRRALPSFVVTHCALSLSPRIVSPIRAEACVCAACAVDHHCSSLVASLVAFLRARRARLFSVSHTRLLFFVWWRAQGLLDFFYSLAFSLLGVGASAAVAHGAVASGAAGPQGEVFTNSK